MGHLNHARTRRGAAAFADGGERRGAQTFAWRGVLFALLALVFALAATGVAADERAGWSYRLAHEVMSPYCPGLTLADCPSGQAADLRAWIIEQERAGRARAEVEAMLFARYGQQLRQTPTADGIGWLAYAAPLAALLLGGALLWSVLARARRRGAPAPVVAHAADAPAASALRDAELARAIDAELGAPPR